MFDLNEIEVILDRDTNTYHAFWRPPAAVGAGNTKEEALRDMKEAIHACVDWIIQSGSTPAGLNR